MATDVAEIDSKIAKLVADMIETMYEAPGVGLAAPQVGVEKRLFVYDIGDGPVTILNPRITESDGEWVYEEGCLSVPGLYFEILRPAQVHLEGIDLDGNEVSIEASELLGRVFQHEVDHLDGILLLERLDEAQLKAAKKELRKRAMEAGS
jgi:peptide deformylase